MGEQEIRYWNRQMETLSRDELSALQLQRLKFTVTQALKTPFYRKRLARSGITSSEQITSLDDLKQIPFTTKDDLRECYPYGLLAVDPREVVRMHTSSGTTGIPTVIHHTRRDLDNWTELVARCMFSAGAGEKDIFQNMTGYGMFTGGLGMHYGAERVGMMVIPAGSGNTKRQIKLMKDFGTTIVHSTPGYMLHIHSQLVKFEVPPLELSLRKAFLGAEPYSEHTRRKIEELFSIDVYNSYGLSEMNGPGVSFECSYKCGMHTWEDAYILEIIDPQSGSGLGVEETGEVVFTTLSREATPLLRYRTRDLACVIGGGCPCGRTHRRISRITGRTDDMLIINGVNIFPSQIEEVIMRIPEVGNNYLVQVEKSGELDKLSVQVEIYTKMFTGDIRELDELKEKIKEELHAAILIDPAVELHEPGSLPVFEGKARRVIDSRPKM